MALLDFGTSHLVQGAYSESVGAPIQGHKLFPKFRPEGSRNSDPVIITASAGGDVNLDRRVLDTSWLAGCCADVQDVPEALRLHLGRRSDHHGSDPEQEHAGFLKA